MNKLKLTSVLLLITLCACSNSVAVVSIDEEPSFKEPLCSEVATQTPKREFYMDAYDSYYLDRGFCEGEGWGSSDDEKPIIIDFDKSGRGFTHRSGNIHDVLHFLGLKAGLKVIYDGPELILTVIYRDCNPIDAIESICKANQLDMIRDGEFVIIKPRTSSISSSNVTRSNTGKYNVCFEAHPLVEAIMETAKVSDTAAFIPAVLSLDKPKEAEERARDSWHSACDKKISLTMKEATPDEIFRKLAELGDMELEDDTTNGYDFRYKTTKEEK